ncbi:MAG: aminotransferase class IV [Sulfuricurvum sp.]|nr:aminotransferase class IV [Sulfuricurvum sp.]
MKPDLLFETIRCEDGIAAHLDYHQKRLTSSLQCLGSKILFDLQALITPPKIGVYRCRFVYNADSYRIEYHPYTLRKMTSLRLVIDDAIHYPLKYTHRDGLNSLFEHRDACDDVLIVKNGILKDTTIANIALLIDGQWFTPQTPLLYGTTRARLINEDFLIPAVLTPNDISNARKIAIMNAMVGFVEIENGIIT